MGGALNLLHYRPIYIRNLVEVDDAECGGGMGL